MTSAMIPTTAGPIPARELGMTMGHEHVRCGNESVRLQWPHAFDEADDLRTCIEWTTAQQSHGVKTVCDPTCMDLYRDVRLNIAVTQATGMRFVMATGVYGAGYEYLPQWLSKSPGVLLDFLVHDIEVGIQGTEVRAGFLKCAADEPGMVPDIVNLHGAVAEASLRTGAPIMAHSNPRTGVALEQMKLFVEAGVDPSRVQIAHVGDTDDLDAIERLLATGCYIGLDRYGLMEPSTEARNATVDALVGLGYGDRLVLGQDCAMQMDLLPWTVRREEMPDWYPTYLFEHALPGLLELGVTQPQIDAMLGSNVHAWLSGEGPGDGGTPG
jgi:phosphotriesterase-related protein